MDQMRDGEGSIRPGSGIVYVSVDVEASGPVPGLFNLVSIGAASVAPVAGRWTADENPFYVELKPIAAGFEPEAMAVHGLSRHHLEAHGTPPEEALLALSRFVETRRGGGRAVFVGHNVGFDWSYISWYYARFGLENPFGYKSLDTKSLAMGVLQIGWFDTSKENLESLLPELPGQDPARAHRADYDALYQARLLAALLNRLPAG